MGCSATLMMSREIPRCRARPEDHDVPRPPCPHDAADPGPPGIRADDLRREGPGHGVPADRAAAAAGRCAERLDRAARRRGLRRVEHVRWAVSDANRGPARGRRSALQPVPHDRSVRADASGVADRPEPSLGGDGQHHRDRDLGTGQQLAAAEHQGTGSDDVEAERVLHRAVRQVSRGAGVAVLADGPVRRLAVGWWRVRDVLRLHRRGEQPVGPGVVRRHHAGRSRRRPPRRATT